MLKTTKQEDKVLKITSSIKTLLRCEMNDIRLFERKMLKHKYDKFNLQNEEIFLTSYFLELLKVVKGKGRE